MKYEEFKELVQKEFMTYMPESYQHLQMNIGTIEKINGKLDGITFIDPGLEFAASPTIYVNDLYNQYQKTENYHKVFMEAAVNLDKAFKNAPTRESLDLKKAKENIVFQLINTEQNKEMLKDMPHREFQDLSVIYRWVVGYDLEGMQSALVKNHMAEEMGLTEEQLFKLAAENYRKFSPPTIRSLNQIVKEMFLEDRMDVDEVEEIFADGPAEKTMWVISNKNGIHGATSILYDDILQEVANRVGSDLYVLPSSVHETIAVSVNMGDPIGLAQMVNDINMSHVSLEERLSNQVYHYDKELRKLTLATDTPNKRLDGLVAEAPLVYGTGDKVR